jgi:hypothetical protein
MSLGIYCEVFNWVGCVVALSALLWQTACVNEGSEKDLQTIRQLYRAERLDFNSFQAILTLSWGDYAYGAMRSCTEIIEWAENQDTKESKIIYQLAHEFLAEIIK